MKKYFTIDYIFWLALILYTNPGGIQQALGIFEFGKLNFNDILFLLLSFCYVFAPRYNSTDDIIRKNIKKYLFVFGIYYFLVHGYLIPQIKNSNPDFIFNFVKLRYALYGILLFHFVYVFWKRSSLLFVKLFTYSSLFILIIFLQSVITGFDILPKNITSRTFILIERNLMLDYGLMPFLTQIGAVLLFFKSKIKYRIHLIIGFILMNIAWIVSLTRRHILALFITLLITLLLSIYITKPFLGKKLKVLLQASVVLFLSYIMLSLFFPVYINAGNEAVKSAIHVIRFGENISGQVDERLAFYGRDKIVKEFEKSPLFGTGFNMNWRGRRAEELGFEASDYPFQAALAMAGLVGCLIFLPIYLLLIKALYKDLKHLNNKLFLISSMNNLFLLALIVFFIFSIMQYMNWFSFISNPSETLFMVLLGFYFAVREKYYALCYSTCTSTSSVEHER